MKDYAPGFPLGGGGARPVAVRDRRSSSTFQTGRVRKLLDDAIQSVLTDQKTPDAALKAAQAQADPLLRRTARRRRRRGPLQPARQVVDAPTLLVTSTAGCCSRRPRCCSSGSRTTRRSRRCADSLFSTGTVVRPSRFVGLEQLRLARRRPDLLEGAGQQLLVRARHHPDLDRDRHADGDVGERPAARRARWCAWPTSRRPCCR